VFGRFGEVFGAVCSTSMHARLQTGLVRV
jgi:hypothetical protein